LDFVYKWTKDLIWN